MQPPVCGRLATLITLPAQLHHTLYYTTLYSTTHCTHHSGCILRYTIHTITLYIMLHHTVHYTPPHHSQCTVQYMIIFYDTPNYTTHCTLHTLFHYTVYTLAYPTLPHSNDIDFTILFILCYIYCRWIAEYELYATACRVCIRVFCNI